MSTADSQTTCAGCEALRKEVAELKALVAQLTAALEDLRRSGKRQAAPFRKPKKKKPKKPGRKGGASHGKHAHRDPIADDDIDEILDVPLPKCCPDCNSDEIVEQRIAHQYQTEIPRRPIRRRFDIHIGECKGCGKRIQGRHTMQTSDALGAAGSQLGANAHAALSVLNKEMGLSHGKCAKVFSRLFGIKIARSASARSMLRSAKRLEVIYGQLQDVARASPWNVPDETGWRIGGENAWLHTTVSTQVTIYSIAGSRGHEILASIIGKEYAGILIRDGFRAYNSFRAATHQLCLAHLLRRCEELIEMSNAKAARFPTEVKKLLKQGLDLRDRYRKGEATQHGLKIMRGKLTRKMRRLADPAQATKENERFAWHLIRHWDHLFNFLGTDDIDATNYRAEQAIRPAVVNRKVWGGNRTDAGALAQSILMSVIVTCHQNALDSLEFISNVLCNSETALPIAAADSASRNA